MNANEHEYEQGSPAIGKSSTVLIICEYRSKSVAECKRLVGLRALRLKARKTLLTS